MGALLAVISAIFYGLWKFGIGQGKGSISINIVILISSSGAATVYLAWGAASHSLLFDAKDIIPGLIGGVCNYTGSFLLLKAIEKYKMGVVTGIGSASCLVPLFYSIAVGEPLSTQELLGLALIFVGLILFCAPSQKLGKGLHLSMNVVICSFLAAFFYGISIIVLDYGTHENLIGTLLASLLPQMSLTVINLCHSKYSSNRLSLSLLAIFSLSGTALAIANMAFYAAANGGDINIGLASVIRSLNPLVIAILARLLLCEKMTGPEVVALAIVLAGTGFVLA